MQSTDAMANRYSIYVKALCSRYPSLLNLHKFLSNPKPRKDSCRIVSLDFRQGISLPIQRDDVITENLRSELQECHEEEVHPPMKEGYHGNHPLQGRILVIEDLTRDVVELLGSELDIDPLFLALHLHAPRRTGMQVQTLDKTALPSRLQSQHYINMFYHRSVISSSTEVPKRRYMRDAVIDRKLVFLPHTNIGLAQHCASVIRIQAKTSFWIGT
jgi:hypothetical protein